MARPGSRGSGSAPGARLDGVDLPVYAIGHTDPSGLTQIESSNSPIADGKEFKPHSSDDERVLNRLFGIEF